MSKWASKRIEILIEPSDTIRILDKDDFPEDDFNKAVYKTEATNNAKKLEEINKRKTPAKSIPGTKADLIVANLP